MVINYKKILSGIICSVMTANILAMSASPVSAETGDFRSYVYDNYEVTYNVSDSWGDTDSVTVSITNTGEETIENWMLYFDPNGEIDNNNMWNVQTAFSSGGTRYFTNAGYNSSILPNSSVSFGYLVNNCEEIPNSFIMCQKRTSNEEYSVQVVVDDAYNCFTSGKYETYYEALYSVLQLDNGYHFGPQDLYADVDAVNVAQKIFDSQSNSLKDILNEYYSLCMAEHGERFYITIPINDNTIRDYIVTNKYFIKVTLTNEQINDSIRAFKDFLALELGVPVDD